jgi:hypothetical protein
MANIINGINMGVHDGGIIVSVADKGNEAVRECSKSTSIYYMEPNITNSQRCKYD